MVRVFPFLRPREAATDAPAPERRGYTDAVTDALLAASTDSTVAGYVAALEIASGQLSRAFASATLNGRGAPLFTPWVMAQIGRSLIEEGEAVWYRIGSRLFRPETYEFTPGMDYTFNGATGEGRLVPADRVFHVRWNIDVSSRRGVSPLAAARTLKQLMQRLEGSLATEANAAVGYLLPVPSDGDSATVAALKEDLASLQGRIAVAETTRGGWGDATASASPRQDFQLARLGPAFPQGNVQLYEIARDTVLAACGFPVQLAQKSDGTAQREAWRRYLHGTVAPAGQLVADAATAMGRAVTLDWDMLFASDVQGRARAFQSLVNGGMSLEAAAAASGILSPQED